MTDAKLNRTMCWMFVLLCIGFILKIQNTANTPVTAGSSGGIWNLVTIFLYGYWVLQLMQNKTLTYQGTMFFGFLYSFFAVFHSFVNINGFSISFVYNVVTIFYFLIIFSIFKKFGENTNPTEKTLNVYILCMLAVGLFVLYHILMHYNARLDDMYIVTDVYYALNMLPLALLSKNKALKSSSVVLTAVLLILSGKRTGFVAFLLGMLVYYMVTSHCGEAKVERNNVTKKRNGFVLLKILVIGLFMAAIFVYLSKKFELDFFKRIMDAFENGESGRDRIWTKIIEAMKNATLGEWVFGHGIKSVPALMNSKNSLAHCDYLEILYDFGLLPFLSYIGFQLAIIGKTLHLIRIKEPLAANMAYCLVIYLFMSFFSNFVIDVTYITYNIITIGLIYGITERKKKAYVKAYNGK